MNGRKRSGGTGAARSMQNKFHAVRTRGYASGHEAERARVLHLLEKAGKIQDLREQVKYELIPAQYENDRPRGAREAAVSQKDTGTEKNAVRRESSAKDVKTRERAVHGTGL